MSGKILKYQKARQVAMATGAPPPEEVAQAQNLSPGFTRILVAVVGWWKKDNVKFAEILEGVYNNLENNPAERALAAENVKSAKTGEERLLWANRALALVPELGMKDGRLIEVKTNFGLWDDGLKEYSFDEVRDALNFLIEIGSFDAPGRVLSWGKKLEDDGDSYVGWLEQVTALSTDDTAANIYWMGKCTEKLHELTGS